VIRRFIIALLAFLFMSHVVSAQMREHMVGFKAAYNISGADFTPKVLQVKDIKTISNYSLVYTYYHDLWKTMPYFGFQLGLSSQEQGYSIDGAETRLKVWEVPLVSQFHVDFWHLRLLLNLGCFAGYRSEKTGGFEDTDYKIDYGFITGGGVAIVFKPLELHIEGNYQYSLSSLYNAKRTSTTELEYAYPRQLLFSAALYIHLNK